MKYFVVEKSTATRRMNLDESRDTAVMAQSLYHSFVVKSMVRVVCSSSASVFVDPVVKSRRVDPKTSICRS